MLLVTLSYYREAGKRYGLWKIFCKYGAPTGRDMTAQGNALGISRQITQPQRGAISCYYAPLEIA
jgi:hypothetical protein